MGGIHDQIGSGFSGTTMTGKEHNDEFYVDSNNRIRYDYRENRYIQW